MAQTAAWTLKSESYIIQMASDKGFPKVTQKFMKETSKKRTKTILHNSAGTYVYSGGRLRHTLLPSEVSYCPDLSGDDKDYMLANTSSKFGIMRPCIISMTEVGATILYFVSESAIPADIKDDYHVGTPKNFKLHSSRRQQPRHPSPSTSQRVRKQLLTSSSQCRSTFPSTAA